MKLDGKAALVTGASRAIVLRPGRVGASVVVGNPGIADFVAFRADDDARRISGQNIRSNGGIV